MARRIRTERARKAQPEKLLVRATAALALFVLASAGLTTAANGPAFGSVSQLSAPAVSARLIFAGTEPVITGSVSHLFNSATFVGPNRAGKTDRVRPGVDVLAVARGFAEVRTRLAALRAGPTGPIGAPQSRFASLETPAGVPEDGPRLSVASIDPALAYAALRAIESVSGPAGPTPLSIPSKLAYARDNAPKTRFSTPVSSQVSSRQSWCLATAVYFEARGESYRGQVAVAQVVMNRVKHKSYPGTICGVVFQNQSRRNACQFSFACDGLPETVRDKRSWAQAEEISKKVLDGEIYLTKVANATHYHASYVYPHWAPRMKRMTKIGLHIFYRFKRRG